MSVELLTPTEMTEADRRAIMAGPLDGYGLMLNAGLAVSALVLQRFPQATMIDVVCGPGNNGGDGYVAATHLAEAGMPVRLWSEGAPRAGSDAERAMKACPLPVLPLADFAPQCGSVVIDALYGAGLNKPPTGAAARAIEKVNALRLPVVAIDLPSGVSGETGHVLGSAFQAAFTVTFVRKKPGHLLLPGKDRCGNVKVVDIGVDGSIVAELAVNSFENLPALWLAHFPRPSIDSYKYSRGHVGVFSGGPSATGAARMAATGAARAGAGAVTMLSPANALALNAAHLTSVILRKTESLEDVLAYLSERKPQALVFGPGLGPHDKVGRFALDLLAAANDAPKLLVIDADGLTSLAKQREAFFAATRRWATSEGTTTSRLPDIILTPHAGEFGRLFPDLAADVALSKLDRARRAAALSNCTIVYKGPDTVIAHPDGRAAINSNGTPLLATAGSGDVLAGIVASLAAQGMAVFEAACAAVWMHAEAAARFGPGLIAEDLPLALLPVLRALHAPTTDGRRQP